MEYLLVFGCLTSAQALKNHHMKFHIISNSQVTSKKFHPTNRHYVANLLEKATLPTNISNLQPVNPCGFSLFTLIIYKFFLAYPCKENSYILPHSISQVFFYISPFLLKDFQPRYFLLSRVFNFRFSSLAFFSRLRDFLSRISFLKFLSLTSHWVWRFFTLVVKLLYTYT